MQQPKTTERLMIRDRVRARSLVVLGLATLALAALVLSVPEDRRERAGVALGVGLAVMGALVLLAARRGVVVTDRGVVLHYLVRKVPVGWEDVVAFDRRTMTTLFGERVRKPALILRNGDCLPVPGADRFGLIQQPSAHLPALDRLELERRKAQQR